jgi:hypothetical protein
MVQKYIIDKNYMICRGCNENYIPSKGHYQCYRCELEQVLDHVQAFAAEAERLANNPRPLIKQRPMIKNMRHPGNQNG